MLPTSLFVAAVLLAATPAVFAQDAPQDQPVEQVASPAVPERRQAIPRSEAPRPAPAPRVEVQPAPRAEAPQPVQAQASAGEQERRAQPRTRARGDNPPVGTAVPRAQGRRDEPQRAPAPPRVADRGRPNVRSGGRTVYAPPVYNNYYYYPRRNYPYGYGAFGLGYFYYDPYRWYPNNYAYSGYGYPGYYPGQGYGYGGFDIGQVRLRVTPRYAQVFVDGYFAGEVDDYDGIVQALKLEAGPYRIEIVAPGYEPLEFDIRVIPGEKITYRGDLRRLP